MQEICEAYADLGKLCTTYDEYLYVVRKLAGMSPRSQHRLHFVTRAIQTAETLDQVEAVYPHLPEAWIEERKVLLRKVCRLTKSKTQLVAELQRFNII